MAQLYAKWCCKGQSTHHWPLNIGLTLLQLLKLQHPPHLPEMQALLPKSVLLHVLTYVLLILYVVAHRFTHFAVSTCPTMVSLLTSVKQHHNCKNTIAQWNPVCILLTATSALLHPSEIKVQRRIDWDWHSWQPVCKLFVVADFSHRRRVSITQDVSAVGLRQLTVVDLPIMQSCMGIFNIFHYSRIGILSQFYCSEFYIIIHTCMFSIFLRSISTPDVVPQKVLAKDALEYYYKKVGQDQNAHWRTQAAGEPQAEERSSDGSFSHPNAVTQQRMAEQWLYMQLHCHTHCLTCICTLMISNDRCDVHTLSNSHIIPFCHSMCNWSQYKKNDTLHLQLQRAA